MSGTHLWHKAVLENLHHNWRVTIWFFIIVFSKIYFQS